MEYLDCPLFHSQTVCGIGGGDLPSLGEYDQQVERAEDQDIDQQDPWGNAYPGGKAL